MPPPQHHEAYCQLLLHLDKQCVLDDMRRACEQYAESLSEKNVHKFMPLSYSLEFDVMGLLDECSELGELLVKEPSQVETLCCELLYACLQTIDGFYTEYVKITQIHVVMRVKCVPKTLVEPNVFYHTGLVSFQGLLAAVTKPASYITHSVWTCPEDCEGNEIIYNHLPKYAPKCYQCKATLFENSRLRACGERVCATLIVNTQVQPKRVLIADDLAHDLILGKQYMITGVIYAKSLHAWSVEPIGEYITMGNSAVMDKLPIHTLPKSIDKLHRRCGDSPWMFVYSLASSLGLNVCPANVFMHVKICLLLSLVSVKRNTGRNIVHVLVADADTGYVAALMTDAASYCDRSVFISNCNSSVPDALIASSEGVCVLASPLHTYKSAITYNILAALEKNEITAEETQVRLNSGVWAHGADCKKFRISNISSVFGTVCRGDYGDQTDDISDFLLQQSIKTAEPKDKRHLKAKKDLIEYIDLVSGFGVVLERKAENIIRDYFLAARKDGQGTVYVTSVTVLAAMSLASARVCRRATANTQDAVFAIWLHVSGGSEPRSAPAVYLDTPADVEQMAFVIKEFKTWLREYIGRHLEIDYDFI